MKVVNRRALTEPEPLPPPSSGRASTDSSRAPPAATPFPRVTASPSIPGGAHLDPFLLHPCPQYLWHWDPPVPSEFWSWPPLDSALHAHAGPAPSLRCAPPPAPGSLPPRCALPPRRAALPLPRPPAFPRGASRAARRSAPLPSPALHTAGCKAQARRRLLARSQNKQPKATSFPRGGDGEERVGNFHNTSRGLPAPWRQEVAFCAGTIQHH